ncbi:MAG: zinc carboxypeptidase [Sphingomonadales bacterium]|nr:zinc carboxypeptidase [Sphingomonadales bacterium]
MNVRNGLLTILSVFLVAVANAQLLSPAAFLGYEIGTRHTPHYLVQGYFQHVAQMTPDRVKLIPYGKTNEGRPLFVAIVSSPSHIASLESIRMNNLRLAGLTLDKMAPTEQDHPALVWLSYNVHGNEASSTEASMVTLYELLKEGNDMADWLKQMVVVIDPCINPDGRDRYVNWYNGVVGSQFNPHPGAREHQEPWPGGRSNHYYFDLNRDWAWQSQVESHLRMQLYQQWMPHVHVDFHEQGYNEPYYFAPAAEPYHEIITPWQREFQQAIGKNHAGYFDKNGWLYFTRERFDLLYPSYGDTYPTYSGAIGMTYEQGGIRAGLGIVIEDGDTLTLVDRVAHHATTSLSTLEVSYRYRQRLISEFRKFYQQSMAGQFSPYKSYVVKVQPHEKELAASLLSLLDRNGIQYGYGTGTSAKGLNYATLKEENFLAQATDIVISTQQPRSALLQVMMEPVTKLADSATYDITAWAAPYAYGLSAFASKEKVASVAAPVSTLIKNDNTSYGYAIPWQGVQAASLVGKLLQQGYKLRYAEAPFSVDGKSFRAGTVLVLKTANERFGAAFLSNVQRLADQAQIKLHAISTGLVDKGFDFGSDRVRPLLAPRVGLLAGEGVSSTAVGEIWHFFDQQLHYPITLFNASSFGAADLKDIDVLIMADGRYRALDGKEMQDDIKGWINAGGKLVALEGAVAQLAQGDWGIKAKKKSEATDKKDSDPYESLSLFGERERDYLSGFTPGAIWKVSLDTTHPLAFGYGAHFYTLKMDDRTYEFIAEAGWNVGVIKQEPPLSGFVGNTLKPQIKDVLSIGQLSMGRGSITLFTDDILFRSFWEAGKLMLCNAVFFSAD